MPRRRHVLTAAASVLVLVASSAGCAAEQDKGVTLRLASEA
ncbi:hypothetical protein [Streptomyces sp. NBC_01244]|nr:hypothetical protein OG247_04895 [Streptomyces sp. NBC_01244]